MKNKMDENQLDYIGSELKGKTIGIIGLGAIGKKVAAFCSVFDMNVLAYARNAIVQSEGFVKMVDFDELRNLGNVIISYDVMVQ
ncbi:NAD(P)-dependent oxidoreductase [Paenibacillus sp. ClWae2A]|uniref:NAD(P)-dependent oxidoreductase n=1 Tax=Paenibacillus sp. ClWae2A TaxID=3057177 RepID=UPI0028F6739C|nr:NAD(P)-dependent oxidoreductase [Paenibacillus sp. ClWae2A]MDT9717849.1 NAD(P)-dependent oxidoreductase [Paenibacillus sp. ClWae2A]